MVRIFIIGLLITLGVVLVWDWFRFPQELSSIIGKWLFKVNINPNLLTTKPWFCSTCQSFWITLIVYLCICPEWCFLSLLWAFLAKYVLFIIETIDIVTMKIIEWIQFPFTRH